jgi:CHAT domain-containing protein
LPESLFPCGVYAGTPAVSVSLWSVESLSAKALNISLFKYIKAGKTLAQALRQSKLDLMANEDRDMYQHPYFTFGHRLSCLGMGIRR